MDISSLWHYGTPDLWNKCLEHYWDLLKPENLSLEHEMEKLDANEVALMPADEFFDFLYDRYFVWKYTAPNRLATTRNSLTRYKTEENGMNELADIHRQLFSFRLSDIRSGLKIAMKIRGLGTAGASGLLGVLFPEYFGIVDQFVVKALRQIQDIPQHNDLRNMKEEGLRLQDGEILIRIMRDKAAKLNADFKTKEWTPRKIDKALWCIGR